LNGPKHFVKETTTTKPIKSSKPRDYGEWAKLEKEFENELNEPDEMQKAKQVTQSKADTDTSAVYSKNKLFKSLPVKIDSKTGEQTV
jgi:hypothetical protein